MTNEQRERAKTLRREGWGYKKIAALLSVSENTIKSFCRTKGLGGKLAASDHFADDKHCRECGNPLKQIAGVKRRKFCTPECRVKWWSQHPESIRHKAVNSFNCPACKKQFSVYGNSAQKYCSHDCYIEARFKHGNRT